MELQRRSNPSGTGWLDGGCARNVADARPAGACAPAGCNGAEITEQRSSAEGGRGELEVDRLAPAAPATSANVRRADIGEAELIEAIPVAGRRGQERCLVTAAVLRSGRCFERALCGAQRFEHPSVGVRECVGGGREWTSGQCDELELQVGCVLRVEDDLFH